MLQESINASREIHSRVCGRRRVYVRVREYANASQLVAICACTCVAREDTYVHKDVGV